MYLNIIPTNKGGYFTTKQTLFQIGKIALNYFCLRSGKGLQVIASVKSDLILCIFKSKKRKSHGCHLKILLRVGGRISFCYAKKFFVTLLEIYLIPALIAANKCRTKLYLKF